MFKHIMSYLANSTWENNRQLILKLTHKNESAKLLDCGCADGLFTQRVAEKLVTNNVFGIEINEQKIQLAEQRGIKVCVADLNGPFPLDSDSFDIVLANQVIEHLYNTDGFLIEIRRVLRPGGEAIVSTPNLAALHYIACLMLGIQPFSAHVSREAYLGNPFNQMDKKGCGGEGHLRMFTFQGLKAAFIYHGFQVETIRGSGYLPLFGLLARIPSRIDPRHAVNLTIKAKKPI